VKKESEDGFRADVAELLCAAIVQCPSRLLACQVSGITPGTLAIWLQRGAAPDAPPEFSRFLSNFLRAEADLARELFSKWVQFSDRSVMDFLLKRFPSIASDTETMSIVQGAEQNLASRAKLLDNPPPRMLAEFAKRGWWRFQGKIDAEDRETLVALQRKYQDRLGAQCPEKP